MDTEAPCDNDMLNAAMVKHLNPSTARTGTNVRWMPHTIVDNMHVSHIIWVEVTQPVVLIGAGKILRHDARAFLLSGHLVDNWFDTVGFIPYWFSRSVCLLLSSSLFVCPCLLRRNQYKTTIKYIENFL